MSESKSLTIVLAVVLSMAFNLAVQLYLKAMYAPSAKIECHAEDCRRGRDI